ncbi:MAG: hypothetical protein R2717_00015 [Schumannella sp.]
MYALARIEREALLELTRARVVDPQVVEAVAGAVSALLDADDESDDDESSLALAFGCALAVVALPLGYWGHHMPALVLLNQHVDDRPTRRAIIAHEGAHNVMQDSGLHHEHGDVWAVALAALMPREEVLRVRPLCATAIALRFGVPYWAAAARLVMVRVLEGEAAHGCDRVIELV